MNKKIDIYIDQHASRSSDKVSAREPREHLSFLAHNIRISCCSRTSSKRKLAAPGENVLSWSNLEDMFALMDYLTTW